MTRRYPHSTGRMSPARSGLVLILVLLASCTSPAANPQGEFQVQRSPYPLESDPYPSASHRDDSLPAADPAAASRNPTPNRAAYSH